MTASMAERIAPVPLAVDRLPLVSVEGITKRFPVRRRWRDVLRHPRGGQQVDVLSDVTLDIGSGEFFGLLGPNGAGKSTLFRLLATVVLPDSGVATIDGLDLVQDAATVRTSVGLVSADERSLNWRLAARENLRFYAALHGMHGAKGRARVEEVLAAVELADVGEKLVGAFSSGMKQRLLIARALLPAPSVLLLDEPTRSLDPIAARRFRRFLKDELSVAQRCTILLATHNAEEALDLCERVGVLHRGRLLVVDSPRNLSRYLEHDRFQAWTRTPDHPAFTALLRERRISDLSRSARDGWGIVEFNVAGDEDRTVDILARLAREGAGVGRLERVQPALADVLEQVVARHSHWQAS